MKIIRNTFRLRKEQKRKLAAKTVGRTVMSSVMDWSLGSVIILETPKENKENTKEEEEQGLNVENLSVIVRQNEVPEKRTCMRQKEERQLTNADIPMPCGNTLCITCNTTDPQKQIFNAD
jgi:hypothetical protein